MSGGPRFQIVAAILAVAAILYIIIVDPFSETIQKAILLGLVFFLSALVFVRDWRRSDEVEAAGQKFSLAVGAGVGVLAAFGFVLFMRHTPPVAEFIARIASISNNGLPPAAVGFALGALSIALLVLLTYLAVNALWWLKRR